MLGCSAVFSQDSIQQKGFYTNEANINGLYGPLNLEDPVAVFRYVFSQLEHEITVFPSENYYYFQFPAKGKNMWGSISLSAHTRDKGILGFGYIEKSGKRIEEDYNAVGGSKDFTVNDGLIVKKINPFRYAVTFEKKTVNFNLKQLSLSLPEKASLMEDENFVGTNFDESGLSFFLIFNTTQKQLYWVLNEDDFVAEEFEPETPYLLIGKRTGFAFYNDSVHNRKILVGVDGYNVLKNNWYDGPFDQLPDNYVCTGQINLKEYIEAAYPADSGKVDNFGNYLEEEGVRVAVAPYYAYYSKDDLIAHLEDCISSSKTESELYNCITEQIFYYP